MPLPSTEPIPFRGVPSRGENKKIALSMTLTQRQVEAMFARQATLNQPGLAAQFPLEIDFDNETLYIGDIATRFSSIKEVGIREICQRTPTPSKPLAGMFLCGNIVGKLNLHRELDQHTSNAVRKATEAETSKRNERTIVRLDAPPVATTTTKKNRSGASALAKKAMSNVRSAKGGSSRPSTSSSTALPASRSQASTSAPSASTTPKATSRSANTTTKLSNPPPSNHPSNSSDDIDPDLNSFRSRLIHFLAPEPRTTQAIVEKFHSGRKPESVEKIEGLLLEVATESTSKGINPTNAKLWEPTTTAYLEVRPWEVSDCTQDERLRMARKARIAVGSMIKQSDPRWRHWNTPTNKIDPQVTVPFKGGVYPAKDKKPAAKVGVINGGGVNSKSKATAKPDPKNVDEAEFKLETKARRIINPTLAGSKGKAGAEQSSPTYPSPSSSLKIPRQKPADRDIPRSRPPSSASIQRESSPVPRPRFSLDERKRKLNDIEVERVSDIEEGELPVKKRRVISAPDLKKVESHSLKKSAESRLPPPQKATMDKGKTIIKDESQSTTKSRKEASVNAKANSMSSKASSSSRGAKRGKEDDDHELNHQRDQEREREKRQRERERQRIRERTEEKEEKDLQRLEEQETERRRLSNKRGRRVTPSFSSDEEDDSLPRKRLAATRPASSSNSGSKPASQIPSSSRLTPVPKTSSSAPSRVPAPSPTLPTSKDDLRREYHIKYARYMSIACKVHEQRAKIEALLAMDGDTVSADDDSDVLDTEALVKLCGEHDRLTSELEKIRNAHTNAM